MRQVYRARKTEKRPIGFVLLGVVLLGVVGWLLLDIQARNVDTVNLPSVYEYKIHQDIVPSVTYTNNSYYSGVPGFGNTAYVAELTDQLKAKYSYSFQSSREADLTVTFLSVATISGKYILGADGKDVNNVWSKDFRLIPAETRTETTKEIVIEREVVVPFSEYRKTLEQYRASLQLPVTSEMQILFSVRVTGTIDGSPIDDARSSVLSAPLDQPIFKISNKFEKDDKKQVAGKVAIDTQSNIRNYERILATVFGVLAIASIVYGMRRQIFKTPYQRELDRIFRYHDGIIIHADQASDMTDKHVIAVKSFNDMLNLEEELKTPIVASSAGPEATRFMIVRHDVVYLFTLGKIVHTDSDLPTLEEIQEAFTARPRHTPKK